MQRDLKVGLSLGVLVLGVVGAFLFRREQVSETPKPTLRTARKIDERIAERPRTPYMTGDVEFDQDDSSSGGKGGPGENGRPANTVPPNWLDDQEDPFQVARGPHGAQDANAIPTQPRVGSSKRPTEIEQTGSQTHVIQSGDSLSTIAQHYLGSQGRFQELYEANRNVLTDPNRLPLGATIVIPASNTNNKMATKPRGQSLESATGKSLVAHAEKARGMITDVSTVEPIAPYAESIATNRNIEPEKTVDQTADTTAAPQTREVRKLFAPSRAPFSNNRGVPVNPTRKPLDPEGEEFVTPPANDPPREAAGQSRHYQVRKGDSLEKISQKVYGNAKRASDIFAANRAQLARPDAVREGQELILPN